MLASLAKKGGGSFSGFARKRTTFSLFASEASNMNIYKFKITHNI
ncbi:MAG: hypothetical protein U5L45_00185 [Saprospiraceae bacterium]|nr:hypothetical protein [Saprospiraceae bacterium]